MIIKFEFEEKQIVRNPTEFKCSHIHTECIVWHSHWLYLPFIYFFPLLLLILIVKRYLFAAIQSLLFAIYWCVIWLSMICYTVGYIIRPDFAVVVVVVVIIIVAAVVIIVPDAICVSVRFVVCCWCRFSYHWVYPRSYTTHSFVWICACPSVYSPIRVYLKHDKTTDNFINNNLLIWLKQYAKWLSLSSLLLSPRSPYILYLAFQICISLSISLSL